ncbi:MAG: phage tail sheath C-terminal domain-containing protein [Bacteroidota bacterium]
MASTYRTPGAYVEEISKFPPSVAAVETAIPAFIGYTEKAERNGESLLRTPFKIDSFLEFEQFFGGPPSRKVIVRLNSVNQFLRIERDPREIPFLLYDSVRLFYDNGGGICYIVSVGDYTAAPSLGNNTSGILGGLKILEKYDEPTLITSPDAVNLDSGLYNFQQQALAQCNKLQNRFLICDLLRSDELKNGETHEERIAQFRDNIGINYLKYGAAYAPWLKTSLPLDLRFRDVTFAYDGQLNPTTVTSIALLQSTTSNAAIQQLIYDLFNASKTVDDLNAKLAPGAGLVDAGIKDLTAQIKKLSGDFRTAFDTPANITVALLGPAISPIYDKIRDIIIALKTISDGLPAVVASLSAPDITKSVEFKLAKDIATLATKAKIFFNVLATHHKEINLEQNTVNLLSGTFQTAIDFLYGTPTTLANVPIDTPTRRSYRLIAAKKAMYDEVLKNANGLATASATGQAVTDSVPANASLLQIAINAAFGPIAGSNLTNAFTTAPFTTTYTGANGITKVAMMILKALAEEEKAANSAATTVGALFPDSGDLFSYIANGVYPEMQRLKVLAEQAAAISGATPVQVVAAVTVQMVPQREYALLAADGAVSAAANAIAFFDAIVNTAETYETTFDQSLSQSYGLYKTLLTKAGQEIMILPPSGGIAGIYASVDSDRGVWKAPANASLSSVAAPLVVLNVEDQEGMNVDPNAGKSINAIRQFTGKGTLVWGTRTLAGNDNEWRYVPVRRFFNYAEESIKKATEPFVFEPNDLNTWVRVRAMIENFLTLEWRRGALAGSKPDKAFYVKVGLGETMTALDILEGRMIIEVGMAVVRPAEFIILRFAHMMQES